jgi:hypothetical protein
MLQVISGQLFNEPSFDREDVYLIRIIDPVAFVASTDPNDCVAVGEPPTFFCGSADFDTRLWLFRIDVGSDSARGHLANDEKSPFSGSSKLVSASTDGTAMVVVSPGYYLLAISTFGNVPLSGGGPIFEFATRTEVSGPSGPGGAGAHIGWSGGGPPAPGAYRIVLSGVEGLAGLCPCVDDGGCASGESCNQIADVCEPSGFSCTAAADCRIEPLNSACNGTTCTGGICLHACTRFGNANADSGDLVNLDDILCLLGGFADFAQCANGDLEPCGGNGLINLDDILRVLAAFGGEDPCQCQPAVGAPRCGASGP